MPLAIQEVIITTVNADGSAHMAPMGIWHQETSHCIVAPFLPSRTLDNLRRCGSAVVNCCDDVRIFAGCLTGRKHWPVLAVNKEENGTGWRLQSALSHLELQMVECRADPLRPQCLCKIERTVNHAPFSGFNRAQAAVLEAAILVSRLQRLSAEEVERTLRYLCPAMNKTAGPHEWQAWHWLMEAVADWRARMGTAISRPEDAIP